ncbi:MAG TPA: bifunctional dihydropteridine reductase/dihydrofolate reductase TmpR [Trueperaceae bacterium]|nr:bifunctional dihydropteridine reductase/dihydrofolate reductase TmpR [Trueperaceae bacterium]
MTGGRPAALVTGSAKGAGRAVLLALAADGFDVAVHYRRSRDEAEAVADEARALGVAAVVLRADVTVEDEARGLVDAAATTFGRLDVLVNNVGDYHHGPLSELDGATWRHMLDSNLNATFYACQQAVPHLRRSPRGGRIVNVGYAGAEHVVARPGIVAYGIAKTGVILYSKALAKVEARHGVTVNVVSPGVLENSVTKPVAEIPMGRVGRLDELAAAVRYLVSPEAAYVTGVTIEVAGGWNV